MSEKLQWYLQCLIHKTWKKIPQRQIKINSMMNINTRELDLGKSKVQV